MKRDIEAALPHRDPFLWIDRIVLLEPGTRCVAAKYVDPAEPCFAGHFPGDPILPGVFLVEASAQTAGVMLAAGAPGPGGQKRLGGISHFKFFKPVRPGTTFEVDARALVERDGIALVSASVTVEGELVASGQVTVVSR
jgi:3-hydroxyacyl-[acyl-carrier-protein] dehydratase